MVNTGRGKPKKRVNAQHGRKPKATADEAATEQQQSMMDNLLTVAALVDWSSFERTSGKLFYEKFGTLLEAKLTKFEATKRQLKECIERNFAGNPKLQTPKRGNIIGSLREKISEMKVMNLEVDDDDDDEEMEQDTLASRDDHIQPPQAVPQTPQTPAVEQPQAAFATSIIPDAVVLSTPEQPAPVALPATSRPPVGNIDFAPETPELPEAVQSPLAKKIRVATPAAAAPRQQPSSKRPPLGQPLQRQAIGQQMVQKGIGPMGHTPLRKPEKPIAGGDRQNEKKLEPEKAAACDRQNVKKLADEAKKQQKLRELEEREKKAQKQREEQLRDKVERAKREREERLQRVEQNNRIKEAERKELERIRLAREAAVKKFEEAQRQEAQATPVSAKKTKQQKTPKPPKDIAKKKKNIVADEGKGCPKNQLKAKNVVADEAEHHNKQQQTVDESVMFVGEMNNHLPAAQPANAMPLQQLQQNCENVQQLELEVGAINVTDISTYDITMNKIPLPSTEDNYNVDDLESGDETDPEDSPRKQIPRWAQKENLAAHIMELRKVLPTENIERYFGRIQQPSLQELFKTSKKKYAQRRPSSATWDSPMSDPTPGAGRYQNMFRKECEH